MTSILVWPPQYRVVAYTVLTLCRIPTSLQTGRGHEIRKSILYLGFVWTTSPVSKPWLLSNIIDGNTNDIPEHLHQFKILERSGVRVGIVGLVEEFVLQTAQIAPSSN
jgi:hypothetical protein